MSALVFPLIMILLGAVGLYAMGRRSFYRRNMAGIEEFNGYGRMLVTTFIERVIRFASFFMLLGGLAMFVFLAGR